MFPACEEIENEINKKYSEIIGRISGGRQEDLRTDMAKLIQCYENYLKDNKIPDKEFFYQAKKSMYLAAITQANEYTKGQKALVAWWTFVVKDLNNKMDGLQKGLGKREEQVKKKRTKIRLKQDQRELGLLVPQRIWDLLYFF